VLTNCLQQSTITLAVTLDPKLRDVRLFNNSDTRYRQSLQLWQDLQGLLESIDDFEEQSGESTLSTLMAGIEKFRSESMGLLMHADWPEFEDFCERIKLSKTDLQQLGPVIHQFRCYVVTLLGQVRMRAVLADVFPVRLGEDDNDQGQTPSNETFNSFSSVYEYDKQIWNSLAVAV
jgi:hypothetical protein